MKTSLKWPLGLVLMSLAHPAQAEGVEKDGWKLAGEHVVLSLEHLATLTAWRETETWGGDSGGRTWGVEASLLTANSTRRSMTEPRVAFDYVSPRELTLGGSVGYVRSGGKQGKPDDTQYVLAPRIGYLIAFDRIAIWLRGGLTLASWSSTHETRDPPLCEDECGDETTYGQLRRVTQKRRTYSVTVDPQLLVCLAPRIALSVGISLDEGLGGTFSQNDFTGYGPAVLDVTSSAYALTTGISAIF